MPVCSVGETTAAAAGGRTRSRRIGSARNYRRSVSGRLLIFAPPAGRPAGVIALFRRAKRGRRIEIRSTERRPGRDLSITSTTIIDDNGGASETGAVTIDEVNGVCSGVADVDRIAHRVAYRPARDGVDTPELFSEWGFAIIIHNRK